MPLTFRVFSPWSICSFSPISLMKLKINLYRKINHQILNTPENLSQKRVFSISFFFSFFFFFLSFVFLGLHPWQMKVPRLGVVSELQPLAYATATATEDPSHVCNLYHSTRQCWILIPLSKARDQTRIFMDTIWVR